MIIAFLIITALQKSKLKFREFKSLFSFKKHFLRHSLTGSHLEVGTETRLEEGKNDP